MWASKLLRGRNARSVTKQSVATAASAPTSKADFSANSQAFSVAVTELLECLDFVLDQLDDQGEHGDLLQFHLSRLAKEISKYENSKVHDELAEPWTGDHDLVQLLLTACRCACSVYKQDIQPGGDLVPVISRTPSITGTIKATSIWKEEDTNTLFVSIRGTSCKADHLVNFNRNQKDAASLFTFPGCQKEIFAHSGFLACATTLLLWLTEEIIRQVTVDDSLTHIVFTGHSAGGAVAALVFLHFICRCPNSLSNIQFSLITFGAPPVTSTNITELAQSLPQTKHILAVVNEHDLVPRVDQSYIASIISLYRSAYGLPLAELNTAFANHSRAATNHDTHWKLPPPDFWVVGNIIVLRAKLALAGVQPRPNPDSTTADMPLQKFDILRVPPLQFCKLLFFEISVHKRKVYLNRLEKLAQQSLS
ncbi:Alpha/Beta hydrolase protein [Fusarium avenaceum]|nr:Alpha/Beta hydrolase protein [Fusarium avenaceum]